MSSSSILLITSESGSCNKSTDSIRTLIISFPKPRIGCISAGNQRKKDYWRFFLLSRSLIAVAVSAIVFLMVLNTLLPYVTI